MKYAAALILSLFFFPAWVSAEVEAPYAYAFPDPVRTLHPFRSVGAPILLIINYLAEPLAFKYERGKFSPALAKSWSYSPDKRTYTFKLREGVKWHDGHPFTADDVKFTFDAYRDPKFEGAIWAGVFEGIDSAEVVDSHTIRFRAKDTNYLTWVSLLTYLRVFPKHFYESKHPERWTDEFVGTGPYVLEKFERGGRILLRQNAEWWGRKEPGYKDTHNFPSISIKAISEPTTAYAMIQTGELDAFPLGSLRDSEVLRKLPGFGQTISLVDDYTEPYHSLWSIMLNVRSPVLASVRTRKALNLLWNRELVNQKLYRGKMQLSASRWPLVFDFMKGVKPLTWDPKEAARLLASDGWKDSDGDGILDRVVAGQKQKFEFTLKFDKRELEPMLTLYLEDAKRLGVKTELLFVEAGTSYQMLHEGRFEAFADKGISYEDIRSDVFKTGGTYNHSGYGNPEIDRLLEELNKEFEPKKQLVRKRELARRIDAEFLRVYGFESDLRQFAVSRRVETGRDSSPLKRAPRYWKFRDKK